MGVLATFLILGGCSRSVGVHVPVSGVELPADRGTTVDVTNFNGSVQVIADPNVKAPYVTARVRSLKRVDWHEGDLANSVQVKAVASVSAAGRVLKVDCAPANDPPRDVAVELTIKAPIVSSTTVHNAGGSVDVVRVSGPVYVDNSGAGGDIQLRTGAAMIDSATLTTTNGKVIYQVGPGSSGRFDLSCDNGPSPEFAAKLGEVANVRPEWHSYRCTLNSGTNPVILRSGAGRVHAAVMADAGEYGPELWDGELAWPTKPRFIGRLGGYYNDEPASLWPKKSE
jgi:hypothetical protein